jgi:hypothetical protein
MHAREYPQHTGINNTILIDLQALNRGSTCRGEAGKPCSIWRPRKMLCPGLCAWVEQRDRLTRLRIRCEGRIRLAQVAVRAGQTEIIDCIAPIRVDVIDMHGLSRNALRGLAVFAEIIRSLVNAALNLCPGQVIHQPVSGHPP